MIKKSTHIARLFSNRNGGIATIFALALVPMLMATGIAVDYGFMYREKTFLQTRADAAAIAGVKEMSLANVTRKQIISAAKASAYQSSREHAGSAFSVDVLVDLVNKQVKVSLVEKWKPFLAQLFYSAITPIIVSAETRSTGRKICVIGLDEKSNSTIHMRSRANLVANNCGVISNSTAKSSIRMDEDATIQSSFTCSAGGVSGKSSAYTPDPVTDCPKFPDPLASRPPPNYGKCNYKDLKIKGKKRTLSPGVYCRGLTISGKSRVFFKPGEYIIKGGKFKITDRAVVTGKNVGFYFTGKSVALVFEKDTSISLTAPENGALAGLLFFEDRNSGGNTHRITSDNARMLLGTIYLPNSSLLVDANNPVADQSAYTAIIVNTLRLEAGPVLTLNSNYEGTNIPVPPAILNAQGFGSTLVFVK